jgi:hypothetical protein
MKTTKIILGLALAFSIFSCSKDDDGGNAISADEATISAKLDIMNDDVSKIVEDQLTTSDGISGKTSETTQNVEAFLPPCATVTRVPAFGTVITPGTTITKTIDFGTVGCPLPNGNVLRGVIVMTFTFQPNATSHTITYTFIDFYHNAIKFNGTKTFTRVMATSAINPNIHPIVTMNLDMTATLPNGDIVTRVGQRVREIIAGYATPIWLDNIYQVTGSWTTTFPNGNVHSSTITTPLRIRMNCPNIVRGVVTIVRNGNTAILDYGDGECDNLATLTVNGNTTTITLGN